MEVAGLVIGGASLAGLFTTCVDCFEYAQVGRQFGKNSQTAVLKLNLLELRLSRWASAVNDSEYGISVEYEAEIAKVKEVLGQIIYLFEEAEKRSAKFKISKGGSETGAEVDLDADVEAIHQKMRNLALKRQKRSSFAQKAVWALHEEKYFNRLVEDVGDLVRDLVEMFPAAKEQQQQLSIEEAQELHDDNGVEALQSANEGEDDLLRESIAQAVASQVKHKFVGNVVKDQVQARYGDEFKGNVNAVGRGSAYERNEASGTATVHYGDAHGYESIFSSRSKP